MNQQRPPTKRFVSIVAVVSVVACAQPSCWADESNSSQESSAKYVAELFAVEILPLLKAKCFTCHGEATDGQLQGELDLRTRDAMLQGGETGLPSIFPGYPDKSLLLSAIR